MAYIEYYKFHFTNDLHQEVLLSLLKEDGVPFTPVQEYAVENMVLTRNAKNPGLFAPIISSMLEVTFNQEEGDPDYWDDFVNATNRTWKGILTVDGQFFFHGYVLPDEGNVPLQDRPISPILILTDNIRLLDQIPLTDYNGNQFVGLNHWIDYLAGILQKLGLDLPIRIYDNVYHNSMFTRGTNIDLDCWGQAKFEARTFDKDGNEKLDCYAALEKLLKNTHRLYYHNGEMVVKRLNMFQRIPGGNFYTVYDPDGSNPQGFLDPENHGEVGVNSLIYPCNENQMKAAKPAYKSVKTNFLWKIWDEVPTNNRFERGSLVSSFGLIREYSIDNWEHGLKSGGSVGTGNPGLTPTSKVMVRTEELNAYGVVIENYIKMETDGFNSIWLRSEGFPANKGDKFTFSVDFRSELDFTVGGGGGLYGFGSIYLIKTDGTRWGLNYDGGWVEGTLNEIDYDPGDDQDTREWFNVSISSNPIPADGTLYIALQAVGSAAGSNVGAVVYWKGFQFNYTPYVSGGFLPVKGDYWNRTQSGYLEKFEDEILVSDAQKGLIKGGIYADGDYLTTPQWFIYGDGAEKAYSQLTNITVFNLLRKRFWYIEGDFTGTTTAPENDHGNVQPLNMGKLYRFVDLPLLLGVAREFILVPPLEINLFTGIFVGRFHEVKNAGDDGAAEGDASEFKYIF